MASVVRSRWVLQPSARVTTAIVWFGVARSSTSASRRAGWAVPVLPIWSVRSGARVSGLAPMARRAAATARVCRPVTITWSTSAIVRSAAFRASATDCSASGT